MTNKYKIIALIGKSGAGKDTLLQEMIKILPNLHEIVSYTSRPQRDYEIDGKSYFFLSEEEFINRIHNNEMLEYTNFNNWYYGTGLKSVNPDKINIGVFNPSGVYALSQNPLIDLKIYYVTASDRIRLIRQLNRELSPNIDEIYRRYKADYDDFYEIEKNVQLIEVSNENEIPGMINYKAQTILYDCRDWLAESN